MNALYTLNSIIDSPLYDKNLKCCFVTEKKQPIRYDDLPAHPNKIEDFVNIGDLLLNDSPERYSGVGLSIQANNICAIDVDHCFNVANDISTADERAKDLLYLFGDKTYCEFSFSGKGLRILFRHPLIAEYSSKYYIKNEKVSIEYYQPSASYRYVTITGNSLSSKKISDIDDNTLFDFLDEYMERPKKESREIYTTSDNSKSIDELLKKVKYLYFKDLQFQNLWFTPAPGSGKDESERDYHLIAFLFENITQDKDKIKEIFESSPFFKSKDHKHRIKWTNQDYRYFNYLYNQIKNTHI